MRKIAFVLTAMMLFLAGCGKEDGGSGNEPNTPQGPTQTGSKIQIADADKTINFTKEAGERSISFTASESWTATLINNRADGWCSVSPTSGQAGSASIKIAVTNNDTPDERSASVQLKSGTATVTIVVTQKQQDALTVTQSRFDVGAEGGDITIVVAANVSVEYSIASAASSWIHSAQGANTRAMTTSQFRFTIDPNPTSEKREGAITVYGNGLSETIMVYQAKGDGGSGPDNPNNPGGSEEPEQPETPSIIVSTNRVLLTSAEQTFSVKVSHNVDVSYQISSEGQSWLSHVDTRAMSTNTFVFSVTENEKTTERTATITFMNKESGLTETVTITQKHKGALWISQSTFYVGPRGRSIMVEVDAEAEVECRILMGTSMISLAEETHDGTMSQYRFIIGPLSVSGSSGCIAFISGELWEYVWVYQMAEYEDYAIEISTDNIALSPSSQSFTVEVVRYNVDVACEISAESQSWLSHADTRATATNTYVFNATENEDTTERTATITFTNKENYITETVLVTQSGMKEDIYDKDIPENMSVAFPDPNFREYVLANFDTDGNGIISKEEALSVTNINVTYYKIATLDGVQYFTNLEYLDCSDNQLVDIDMSHNTKLITLLCDRNKLTSLDVSGHIALKELSCSDNKLISLNISGCTRLEDLSTFSYNSTTLTWLDVSGTALKKLNDFSGTGTKLTFLGVKGCHALERLVCTFQDLTSLDLSGCTALKRLECYGNSKITSLDVSECTALEYLECGYTWSSFKGLTSLNVKGCTALRFLYCYGSYSLPSLDVSGCTALVHLSCYGCDQLTSLDVSGCTALEQLLCYGCKLTSLDVSECTALETLKCYSNQLTSLDISKTNIGAKPGVCILDCHNNPLKTLYLKAGWDVAFITYSRSSDYIPDETEIVYVD